MSLTLEFISCVIYLVTTGHTWSQIAGAADSVPEERLCAGDLHRPRRHLHHLHRRQRQLLPPRGAGQALNRLKPVKTG